MLALSVPGDEAKSWRSRQGWRRVDLSREASSPCAARLVVGCCRRSHWYWSAAGDGSRLSSLVTPATMCRALSAYRARIRGSAGRWAPWAPAGLTLALAVKGCWPALPGWPCPLRALTGIPCPTCFLTRATAAALTGQLEHSFRLHAFGLPVAAALLVWSLVAIRRRRVLPFRLRASTVVLAGLGLLLYWLVRLILQFGFGVPAFVGVP